MRAAPFIPPPLSRHTWTERNAGWILSLCLHVAFVCAIFTVARPLLAPPHPPAAEFHVRLVDAPTPPEPSAPIPAPATTELAAGDAPEPAGVPNGVEARSSAEEPSAPAGGAAPSVNSINIQPVMSHPVTAQPKASHPAKAVASAEKAPASHPAEVAAAEAKNDAKPDKPAAATGPAVSLDMAALRPLKAVPQMPGAGQGGAGGDGSSDVADRLRLERADLKAEEVLFRPDGVDRGASRELDLSDVTPQEAQQIMTRYGIKIIYAQGNVSSTGGYSYLSSASTHDGKFMARAGSGTFSIFDYGDQANARMAQLEAEALKNAGYAPGTGRVQRIVFGAVPTLAGLDLGVKLFQAYPVPGAIKTSKM